MNEERRFYLTCVPVDKKDAEELGLAMVIPGPGFIKSQCEKCHIDVWIGPRQKKHQEENPNSIVICFKCGIEQQRALPKKDRGPITSLGGKSSTLINKDGTIYDGGRSRD